MCYIKQWQVMKNRQQIRNRVSKSLLINQQQHEDDQVKLKLQLAVLAQDRSGLNRTSMTTNKLPRSCKGWG
jgi:hypothetical protein